MLDWQWLRRRNLPDGAKQGIVIGISLLFVGIIYILGRLFLSLQGMDEGLFTEILGIILTVLLIDGLRNISADIEIRASLIRRAASTSNETAKAAIDELRKTGLIDRGVLRGEDLSGANLCGAMLENADLSGVNLENAYLSVAKLNGANLTGAILRKTKFYRTKMVKVNLASTDLMGTEFREADLTEAIFKSAHLDEEGPRNISSAEFVEAKLIDVDFSHLRTMKGSTFAKCDLQGTDFNHCDLENADFTESDLKRANLRLANLRRCNFSLCNLDDAIFQNSNLQYANITGANLERANLEQARLDDADYGGSVFSGAILHGAHFTKTKPDEVTEQEEANFIDAKFDIRTTLPDGSKWDSTRDQEMLVKFGMRRADEDADDKDKPPNLPRMR